VTQLPSTNGRPSHAVGATLVIPAIVDGDARVPGERSAPDATKPASEQARARAAVLHDAPAIYGGLLVTALITVQWQAAATPELIALSAIVCVLVFWLTHVWAEVVERRLNGPIARSDVLTIASREASMFAAAVPPVLVLALGRLGVLTIDQAIAAALVVCVAQLFLWGLAIGKALGRGWPVALGVAAIECGLGALLVGLKVAVVH
jgi:hypothetical protein